MCGRFSQSESSRRLAAMFDAELDGGLPAAKYNVAPTDEIRIVLERRSEREHADGSESVNEQPA